MRVDKQVELTGQPPIRPIELSDLVVGMNHLAWSPMSHERFILHRRSPLAWVTRSHDPSYWIEAEINESDGQRTLHIHGRAPVSERRKLDALLEALQQGKRWLNREGPLG